MEIQNSVISKSYRTKMPTFRVHVIYPYSQMGIALWRNVPYDRMD